MRSFRLPAFSVCLSLFVLFACHEKPGAKAPAAVMFRGDAARTGFCDLEGPARHKGVKWIARGGGRFFSSPVLSGGVLFAGCDDSCLYAVEAASGRGVWKFRSLAPVRSTPAVSEGVVCFTGGDGSFYALRASDGDTFWEFATRGENHYSSGGLFGLAGRDTVLTDPWDFFDSSPAIWQGKVYFGSGDGSLYCLELATGREVWRFPTCDVVHSSPALAEGRVFVGGYDTNFYALDAETGRELWRFSTGADPKGNLMRGNQGSPAAGGGAVYFGSRDGHLYALEAASGKQLWAYSTEPSWVVDSPALTDSLVLFGTSDSGRFIALDRATGALRFEFDAKMFVFSSPVAARNAVYVGSFNGRLYALGLPGGEKLWEYSTLGSRSDPRGVLLPDGAMNKAAFKLTDQPVYDQMCQQLESMLCAGAVITSPLVTKEAVYFAATDSCLYAVE
ncbi:PQQ-binding-like beta-propeller repeat protein [bacterium]|nr:PQQ-binding-like beta-propeller repeat protein [bacterium]